MYATLLGFLTETDTHPRSRRMDYPLFSTSHKKRPVIWSGDLSSLNFRSPLVRDGRIIEEGTILDEELDRLASASLVVEYWINHQTFRTTKHITR